MKRSIVFFNRESAAIVAAAAAGAGALALLHSRPFTLLTFFVALNALFLAFRHDAASLAGFLAGAIFGNATELAADLAGLWIHREPRLLGVSPYYIFACYPVLGLAFPLLIKKLSGRVRPKEEGARRHLAYAVALWAVLIAGACLLGGGSRTTLCFCALALVSILARFHSPSDLLSAPVGALLGMVWEIPGTLSGAWRFPRPEILGLIPLWLILAYAGYFVLLGRITAGIIEWRQDFPDRWL